MPTEEWRAAQWERGTLTLVTEVTEVLNPGDPDLEEKRGTVTGVRVSGVWSVEVGDQVFQGEGDRTFKISPNRQPALGTLRFSAR